MDVYTTQISTFPSPRWLTHGPQGKSSILFSGIIGPHAASPSSLTDHLTRPSPLPWTLTSCQGHVAMPVTGELSAKGGLSLQTLSPLLPRSWHVISRKRWLLPPMVLALKRRTCSFPCTSARVALSYSSGTKYPGSVAESYPLILLMTGESEIWAERSSDGVRVRCGPGRPDGPPTRRQETPPVGSVDVCAHNLSGQVAWG